MTVTAEIPSPELQKIPVALRAIAGASGVAARKVLHGFAGVVLKACAGQTKVSTVKQANRSASIKALHLVRRIIYGDPPRENKGSLRPGTAGINLGIRGTEGRVYYRTRKRGLLGGRAGLQDVFGAGFRRGKHIAPADWTKVQSLVNAFRTELGIARDAGKRSIGLARQSWVQIADSLGIRLETVRGGGNLSAAGIAKARRAIATTGAFYQNGIGREEEKQSGFLITLINRYPGGRSRVLGLDRTLNNVLIGQARYFERNLKLGVFNSIEKTARAYPFLKVHLGTS